MRLAGGRHAERVEGDLLPLRRVPPTAVNVHGHIHRAKAASRRHFNVSVERTDYAPVGLTWVLDQARGQETKDAAGKVNR